TKPPGVAVVAHAASAAEAVAQANRLRRLAPDVHLNFPIQNEFAMGRMRSWIGEQLARWQRPQPSDRTERNL
ncbi:MAG TPA: hypothetical protein VFH47_04590, partial [Candidatus Thermoplasmatota archaeon]|nr:hypothetical protein [Candidatus Thermoplasmatota archaeon]